MEDLTYDDIFGRLVKSAFAGDLEGEIARINSYGPGYIQDYVKYASGRGEEDGVVFKVRDCERGRGCGENRCQAACLFGAISRDEEGKVVIKRDYCSDCGECVKVCDYGCLVDKKEFVPLVRLLQDRTVPVYAIVAPAFVGQFGPDVTPGKLRTALKRLGFYGMIEVALFADMLTLKEALEFDINVRKEGDFVLTSCCCPMWVAMIRKVYKQLVPRISPSVSPMVACGRGVKRIHPEARAVFIGPCVAKKAEAKEEDVKDAVDAVVTFKELQQVFEAVGINPAELEDEPSEHSSEAGRIYARTGGVSQAVAATLRRLRPHRDIPLKAVQADGVRECRKMLEEALAHQGEANFYEGMGCTGGCVGGPQAVIDPGLGAEQVNRYGSQAVSRTPADNPYVLELLKALGYMEIDELLEGEKANMFVRDFGR